MWNDNTSRPLRPGRAMAAVMVLLLAAGSGCGWLKRTAYDGFARDGWQQPDRVIETLALAPGARVADLGAGGGYFTFRLADAVGADGRVYAVDVDEDMTTYLRDRAADEQKTQVVPILAEAADPKLPEPVDLIFTCNTYHHFSDRVAYFAGLRSSLRAGGRVAIIDFHGVKHGTEAEIIDREMSEAGYAAVAAPDFLEKQNFRIYQPKR